MHAVYSKNDYLHKAMAKKSNMDDRNLDFEFDSFYISLVVHWNTNEGNWSVLKRIYITLILLQLM